MDLEDRIDGDPAELAGRLELLVLRQWVWLGGRRKEVLRALEYPLTTRQLARRIDVMRDGIGYAMRELHQRGLVECLNPTATSCRIYGTTALGARCRQSLFGREEPRDLGAGLEYPPKDDRVFYELLGWCSYVHRSAIIRAMEGQMQPASVKRRAKQLFPDLRMSANNCRDAMKLMESRGIIRRVGVRGKTHPRFALTKLGRRIRELLLVAEG
jgi:DNA-binding Lrp family transcriptional regulator